MEQKVKEQLKERFVEQCLFGEPLLNHTTYKTGGKADAFVSPKNEEDLVWLLKFCKKNKLDFFVLGFGAGAWGFWGSDLDDMYFSTLGSKFSLGCLFSLGVKMNAPLCLFPRYRCTDPL